MFWCSGDIKRVFHWISQLNRVSAIRYIPISSLFPCLHHFTFFAIVTGLLCDKWQFVKFPYFSLRILFFPLLPSYIQKKKKRFLHSCLPWGLIPEALQVFEQTSVSSQIKPSRKRPDDSDIRERRKNNNNKTEIQWQAWVWHIPKQNKQY